MHDFRRVVKQSNNAKWHVVILIICLGGLLGSVIYAYLRAEKAVNSEHKPEKVEVIKEYFTDTSKEQFLLPYVYIHGVLDIDGWTLWKYNESTIISDVVDVLNLPLPSNNRAQKYIMTMDEEETLEFFRWRRPMDIMTYTMWYDWYSYWSDWFTDEDNATFTWVQNTIGYIPSGFYPWYTDDDGTVYTVSEIRAQAWTASSGYSWNFLMKLIWEDPPLALDNLVLHIEYTINDDLCWKINETIPWAWCTNSWLSLHFSEVDYFELHTKEVVSTMYDSEGWCTIPKLTNDELHNRDTTVNLEKETHNGVSHYSAISTLDFTEIEADETNGKYNILIYVNSKVEQWVEYSEYEYTDAFAFVGSVYTAMWSILLCVSGYLVWRNEYKDPGLLPIFNPSEGHTEEIKWLEGVTEKLLSILTGNIRDEDFIDEDQLERQYSNLLDTANISVRRRIDIMMLQLARVVSAKKSQCEMENFIAGETNFESSSNRDIAQVQSCVTVSAPAHTNGELDKEGIVGSRFKNSAAMSLLQLT